MYVHGAMIVLTGGVVFSTSANLTSLLKLQNLEWKVQIQSENYLSWTIIV